MLIHRLINVIAPAYFLCISLVTFALQVLLFIPSMSKEPSSPLFSPALLHGALLLFLLINVLGNYILVIQNSPEDAAGACGSRGARDGRRAVLPANSHFCKLCGRMSPKRVHHCFFTGNCIGSSNLRNFLTFCFYTALSCFYSLLAGVAYISSLFALSFASPLTFLTLLPLSITRFFSGALHGLEMFVILMLFLWLGIGLACAGFCCHQLLLILRGQMRYQACKGRVALARPWQENLRHVFGKRWMLGLLLPVRNMDCEAHQHKEH
ncbi:palmitoyltransferase ZDHHC22 [Rhinatrema bivittatum]|uniref:palmitoyltransferase ZDHHC22 n=1 Tax=Rhinatrema bivittatum TaxID=194408 RepID=UPI00112B3F82|nr:palmitoyltransferase ZDHHC22 [Rhinatrema bivittatum]